MWGIMLLRKVGVLVDFVGGQFGRAHLVPKSPSEQSRMVLTHEKPAKTLGMDVGDHTLKKLGVHC